MESLFYFLGVLGRYVLLLWLARMGYHKLTGESFRKVPLNIIVGLIAYALSSKMGVEFDPGAESWAILLVVGAFILRDRYMTKSHKSLSEKSVVDLTMPGGEDLGDVVLNFMAYTKDYLMYRSKLSKEQVEIQMCDPVFGQEMDAVKSKWADELSKRNEDPDYYLVGRRYDHERMNPVNEVISKYGASYNDRESGILNYLRSIGHPLASNR